MAKIAFYLFAGFFVLVGAHWLFVGMPRYLLFGFGSRTSSASALAEVDLRDASSIKASVSQGYGSRSLFAALTYVGGRHNGTDFSAKYGAPVYSPISGKVLAIGNQDKYCYKKNYGKFMVIENEDDGYAILLAHLSKINFDVGEKVIAGDIVAEVGATGLATAPHLHLTVFKKDTFEMVQKSGCGLNPAGKDADPIKYLESLF
ncbi:MAG: M23 family metallopeptidase [bacterium]|nr:M23 family metallopeptidase [bacterium]